MKYKEIYNLQSVWYPKMASVKHFNCPLEHLTVTHKINLFPFSFGSRGPSPDHTHTFQYVLKLKLSVNMFSYSCSYSSEPFCICVCTHIENTFLS